ncbi:MAG: FAD-dependent oxidoreductase [Acidobacteriota bacterium]|nr:FAD-dependent oxidoreductase [Acidobacteriota bacterium]
MDENIVILGGGYAGALAAARIAKRGIRVTLVDTNAALVERIRLHQVAAGDDIAPIPYARLFRDLPVETIQARVTGIDRERKRVATTEGTLAYDKLVYALGSTSVTPEHAISVGNPLAVRAALRESKHVVIVGGGLTGIETAAEIAERHPHLDVTLIDAGTIGGDLAPKAQRHLRDFMQRHGVTLFDTTRVTAVDREGVILGDGSRLYASSVLWCGAFALSPIAREAGLEVNARGQIVVDDHLRSSDASIYAVGDAAAFRDLRMACAVALPMGAYIADVLSGATRDPFRFAFAIRCISLGRNDGIIQFVNPDDSPRDRALTGRPAAWVKEFICRFTVLSVRLESRGVHYRWPKMEAAA